MGMVEGKVGIISGATRGIGARTAQLLVAERARVVFTGRRWAHDGIGPGADTRNGIPCPCR
jgi:NAD(P)-dependent dehydrogenase (short-subunit alcohol dehydrogenase family)